ncbi:hypothetical protein N3K66_004414 [Trichothecium roseum]|uniref:Uncharacterized protein n=1 Tax=Trichothecium roseum TaxID=47278 RepID=A0ACC0V1J6_9HYPO|nr:hypothetical protein N3K66_004414 [Trichothecium roseum]
MAVAPAYHESLPYIDSQPTEADLAAAHALIAAEASSSSSDPNPSTSSPEANTRKSHLTPALEAELSRVADSPLSPPKLDALSLSRYEALEPPQHPSDRHLLLPSLGSTYASAAYLALRASNLALLERHGRNAWLLANHQLEAELRRLEAELADAKRDIDLVNLQRRARQDDVAGEMALLEDKWKKGVGRVLETEIAVEEVKAKVRDELRRRAAEGL